MSYARKVAVVLVDRANYGRLKPVMRAIQNNPKLELLTVAAGTMVLERFAQPVNVVRQDGFRVDSEIHIELEGSTPTTMAKSVGFGIIEFASEFQRLKPDILLVIGDRYEALAAATAAAYMNICIVHLQGGEVSGSIDESARHAITKLAHYHLPSTRRSAEYLIRMGERPDTVLGVGCPSSDIARELDLKLSGDVFEKSGSGAHIDPAQPFLLVVFHPITTQFGGEIAETQGLLEAIHELGVQTVMLWPNIDAGADHISKTIRRFREATKISCLRTLTNLPPEEYLKVLANAACAIGNSSSFVRDASYFGTPVVLLGKRQEGRETDKHVVRCLVDKGEILKATRSQLKHGRYPPSQLYGDGQVSEQLSVRLESLQPYVQKRLHYIYDNTAPGGPPLP